MRLIGLTGGIATGKTTVSMILETDFKVPVIRVDMISRIVTQKNSPTLDALVRRFGSEILTPDGMFDRAVMRHKIISNAQERRDLEQIMIPAITAYSVKILNHLESQHQEIAVVENALMFEQQTNQNYQEIIVVSCHPEIQLRRVMERDQATKEQAQGIIDLQWSLLEKERLANYVIYNNKDFEFLKQQTYTTWQQVLGKV